MKTYNVKYEIHLNDGSVISNKEMKVKNCSLGVEAQCKLEKYLIKKNSNFSKLVVHSCTEDIMSAFDGMFGDKANPFGNMFDGMGDFTAGGSAFGKK
jgi:hypothetical protein